MISPRPLKTFVAFISLLMIGALQCRAQFSTPVPLHEGVTHGQLDNGMTYYILHNEWPKDRVSFYFAQNVGAILENDTQDGLAHFLEHMAFNGTENFKGKGIIDMLERHGVRFGPDINAYTAHDQTVYNLSNVPSQNEQLIDSSLLVLHDWSGYLLLEEDEIDAERGVVREEWRTRRNSSTRLMEQTNKALYKGSKYVKRDVIGSLDIINNFNHQELRDYYEKWYRPDQQAIIVVGDIDEKQIEEKIKEMFSPIPMPANPATRYYESIPDNEEMLYVLAKDKEARQTAVTLLYKYNYPEEKGKDYLRDNLVTYLCTSMLNKRYAEYLENGDAAALSLQVGSTEVSRLHGAFYISATAKKGEIKAAFKEALIEVERASRYGFTEDELERTKQSIYSSYENYLKNKDKISSDSYATQLADHYLKAEPFQTPETRYEEVKKQLASISLEEIYQAIQKFRGPKNAVLTVTGPDKQDVTYPEENDYKQILEEVGQQPLEAYRDFDGSTPLVAEPLEGAEILRTFTVQGMPDALGYVLSNGAKVVLYPTTLSKDQVLFSAFSKGGSSLIEAKTLPSSHIAAALAVNSGLGDYKRTDLQKKLAGKIANVSPYIGELSEGLGGSTNQKDLETLLQLTYLYFEHPRFDENAYKKLLAQYRNSLDNVTADNNKALQDTIALLNSNYSDRTLLLEDSYVENLDMGKAEEIYRDRLQNAADFTYVFAGNITEEQLPLIQKYIGSIKGDPEKNENHIDHGIAPAPGISKRTLVREMDAPKTTVYVHLAKEGTPYSNKNRITAYIIGKLLSKRYLDIIREEEGGSYGVSANAALSRVPDTNFSLEIQFDSNPEKADQLVEVVYQEIENIQHQPIDAEYLESIKTSLLKNREEQVKSNSFWLQSIVSVLLYDEAFIDDKTYVETVQGITPEDVQSYANTILSDYRTVEVIMKPKQ